MLNNYKQKIYTLLILLSTAMVGVAQIPNAGFENWTNNTFPAYSNPNGWGTLNSNTAILGITTVQKATATGDYHGGTSAIKLISRDIPNIQVAPGLAITGTINTNTEAFEGGFPIANRPTALTGWYKASPASGDLGQIEIRLFKRVNGMDSTIGEATFSAVAQGSYVKFIAPITYHTSIQPDSAMVMLFSSNPLQPVDGSVLFVDDLALLDCSTFMASASSTPTTTVGGNNGTADVAYTPGTSPYTFAWSNNTTTQQITGLTAGQYCVTVNDAGGCSATACTTVSGPTCNLAVGVTTTDATTNGGTNGTATSNITGASGATTYLWNTGAITQNLTGLGIGNYCITVTDNAGCTASACGVVSDPGCNGFSVSSVPIDATTVGGQNGGITLTITGGTPTYSVSWSNSTSVQNLSNVGAGEYCYTVTDVNNCIATGCDTVNEPFCGGFSVAVNTTNATTVGGTEGTATAVTAGGSATSYLWTNSATNNPITGLGAGSYCVTVTNSVNCSASACGNVTQPSCSGQAISITYQDPIPVGNNNGSASVTLTGGNGVLAYQWSNGGNTQTISNLTQHIYCVTVIDAATCTATACAGTEPVGIEETLLAQVKVYPNPSRDVLTIETASNNVYEINITSLDGKIVLSQKLTQAGNTIDIHGLANGMYLYKINSTTSTAATHGKLQVIK